MNIIGIMLLRNEDRFVEWAIRNAIDFCDEMLVADHGSTDGTWAILERLSAEYAGKLKLHRIDDPAESHELIRGYAGGDHWIFAVDGDEVYDPAGLQALRARILAGEYHEWWVLFGNMLNVTRLDPAARIAEGHLAPPCRSATKLFNFRLITDWPGGFQRLHGGRPEFRKGYHAMLRRDLHLEHAWEDSIFRCLHLCFLQRSSQDTAGTAELVRPNVTERHRWKILTWALRLSNHLKGRPSSYKEQRYRRGPLVTKSYAAFLRP